MSEQLDFVPDVVKEIARRSFHFAPGFIPGPFFRQDARVVAAAVSFNLKPGREIFSAALDQADTFVHEWRGPLGELLPILFGQPKPLPDAQVVFTDFAKLGREVILVVALVHALVSTFAARLLGEV